MLFTGLSGAGKSTLANALAAMLRESGDRPVTLFDGDVVPKQLSSELGFSREHREINLRRIGFVAVEIARTAPIAISAPIAPYAASRRELRETGEAVGGFAEVHVSTPLQTCEARDRKGLYARARGGLIRASPASPIPVSRPSAPTSPSTRPCLRPDLAAECVSRSSNPWDSSDDAPAVPLCRQSSMHLLQLPRELAILCYVCPGQMEQRFEPEIGQTEYLLTLLHEADRQQPFGKRMVDAEFGGYSGQQHCLSSTTRGDKQNVLA